MGGVFHLGRNHLGTLQIGQFISTLGRSPEIGGHNSFTHISLFNNTFYDTGLPKTQGEPQWWLLFNHREDFTMVTR